MGVTNFGRGTAWAFMGNHHGRDWNSQQKPKGWIAMESSWHALCITRIPADHESHVVSNLSVLSRVGRQSGLRTKEKDMTARTSQIRLPYEGGSMIDPRERR
ncbi:hypothetical protein ACFX1S_041992 [Malus domestica]